MEEEVKKAEPPKRDYNLLLGPVLHKLLQAAPQNPAVRTHVMSVARKPVPENAATYDDIVAWLDKELPQIAFSSRIPRETSYPFYVRHEEVRRGTCNYIATHTANHQVRITVDDIMRLGQETAAAGGNMDAFSQKLFDYLVEISEDEVGSDWFAENNEMVDCDYSNYDEDDADTREADVPGKSEVLRTIKTVLLQACPELINALNSNIHQ